MWTEPPQPSYLNYADFSVLLICGLGLDLRFVKHFSHKDIFDYIWISCLLSLYHEQEIGIIEGCKETQTVS